MGIQYELLHPVDSQNDLMIGSERCSKILSVDWSGGDDYLKDETRRQDIF